MRCYYLHLSELVNKRKFALKQILRNPTILKPVDMG